MQNLKIFAKTVEQEAIDQVELLLAQPAFQDCKVRIMPDTHAGKGCVIGFTADLGDKVIPNIVGVDLGCFVGDTKIPLLDGTQKTLKEMHDDGGEFWVYSIDENKHITNGKAISLKTGKNSKLIKVKITGGDDIICTPSHRFMLRDGTYKEAQNLQYQDSMSNIFTTSVCSGTLDEAPMAYKFMDEIVECIKDTVDVVTILNPIYNFKASE